jgi:acyl-CoA thioester hydrolase
MISAEIEIVAQFYDLDPMQVVWHGNYAKFLEQARCALLDKIGYSYPQMHESGFLWPIVEMQLKYVRPIRYAQVILVSATLVEYENRLKVSYRCRDKITGEVLTKAHTTQVAVDAASGELCLESPPVLIDKIRSFL